MLYILKVYLIQWVWREKVSNVIQKVFQSINTRREVCQVPESTMDSSMEGVSKLISILFTVYSIWKCSYLLQDLNRSLIEDIKL